MIKLGAPTELATKTSPSSGAMQRLLVCSLCALAAPIFGCVEEMRQQQDPPEGRGRAVTYMFRTNGAKPLGNKVGPMGLDPRARSGDLPEDGHPEAGMAVRGAELSDLGSEWSAGEETISPNGSDLGPLPDAPDGDGTEQASAHE